MSLELWFAVAIGVVLVLVIAFGISLLLVARRAAEQSDDLSKWTSRELKTLSARVAQLENMNRPDPFGPCKEGKAASPHNDTDGKEPASGSVVPPVHTAPPTLEEVYEQAAGALASAGTFNAFAEKYRGQGFTLEPGGPPPSPASGAADRADIYLLKGEDFRLALPGFNLRRGQGLLTSDAGRAAEARLGWLFDIEAGPELRAIEGAVVEPDNWTVRRKGRLSIPL